MINHHPPIDIGVPNPAPCSHGFQRRMARLLARGTGRLVLAPVDDSLLAGPFDGLESIKSKIGQYAAGPVSGPTSLVSPSTPDAVIGYRVASCQLAGQSPLLPYVFNLTSSSTLGVHVQKCQTGTVNEALAMDASAVAVHVNFTSRFESEQLALLGSVATAATSMGMPLMGILYPRREIDGVDDNYNSVQRDSPDAWANMVAHVTRIGAELGCSIIKTQWTGSSALFERVVRAGEGALVVIAGGKPKSPPDFISMIQGAIDAGAAGISFGRNFFNRADSRPWICAANQMIHGRVAPKEALAWLNFSLGGL